MKAMYCEIERGRGSVRVNIYRRAEELEKAEERRAKQREQRVERQRSRVHIQEVAGGFVGLAGFLMLMGMEGQENLWGMAALGAVGIGLMILGAWMGHAFYGQEDKAEWLRRMRERGEIE